MIFDTTTVPQRPSVGNTIPVITLTQKGEIRFNQHAREVFRRKDRVYFRFYASDGVLYCIEGPDPKAFSTKANNCTHITHKPLVEKIKNALDLKVDRISFKVLPAIERRHEGFVQYPLSILNQ